MGSHISLVFLAPHLPDWIHCQDSTKTKTIPLIVRLNQQWSQRPAYLLPLVSTLFLAKSRPRRDVLLAELPRTKGQWVKVRPMQVVQKLKKAFQRGSGSPRVVDAAVVGCAPCKNHAVNLRVVTLTMCQTCQTVTGVLVVCFVSVVVSLENGLARTPPMGWLAWERFRCNTDCKNDPDNCISENLFRTMADIVTSEGYAAAGYEYINVDDCWLEKERDNYGRLVADRQRFPRGIKSLADYVHSKGLKFGIYEDFGNYTCAGYPGVLGYLRTDAETFASWDVDYVKLDGCYAHPSEMDRGYPEFGYYLNRTGRPMMYSCSWPVYQIYAGMQPNFTSIIQHCNLWRNFDDIQDSWASVESIIDYYGNNQDVIVANAGPGHWNDPDMLIIGNFGLSYEQSKTQMAIWAILAAPLLMSVDLRSIRPEYKAILQNRKIIGVDQDPLGIQGRRIYKHKGIEIWSRPITPLYQNYFSYAIAFLNRRTDGTPSDVAVTLKELGLTSPTGYRVEDLYEDVDYGVLSPQTKIKVKVNPSGVVILRADVQAEFKRRIPYYTTQRTIYNPLDQVFRIRNNGF